MAHASVSNTCHTALGFGSDQSNGISFPPQQHTEMKTLYTTKCIKNSPTMPSHKPKLNFIHGSLWAIPENEKNHNHIAISSLHLVFTGKRRIY
tara:strand:+ start:1798 stop:2076 length:279 start_codon:yes stop_codon:yes gene_type:complete